MMLASRPRPAMTRKACWLAAGSEPCVVVGADVGLGRAVVVGVELLGRGLLGVGVEGEPADVDVAVAAGEGDLEALGEVERHAEVAARGGCRCPRG